MGFAVDMDVDFLTSGPDDGDTIRRIVERASAIGCPDDGVCYDLTSLKIESIRHGEAPSCD